MDRIHLDNEVLRFCVGNLAWEDGVDDEEDHPNVDEDSIEQCGNSEQHKERSFGSTKG